MQKPKTRYSLPMRLPPRPELSWKEDGTPVDDGVGDVYFSRDDGLAESRAVFLQGCGLPLRWADADQFTVAELGFGTGLNILALWQLWRQSKPSAGWLNVVSFEGFPLDRDEAARALFAWPELSELSAKLLEVWPERVFGAQHFVWPEDRLSLTLHIGDIAYTLPQTRFQADAWFLDGFSPAKNEAMWDTALWPLLAERSAKGARIGTFTVAGHVRRGLEAAGCSVARLPGHGRKRQRLEAVFTGAEGSSAQSLCAPGAKIAVIGAGIAGAMLAYQAKARGLQPTVFDGAAGPAQGTSGNPLALVMPRLDAGDTAQAHLLLEAYVRACAGYAGLPGVVTTAVAHRPKDDAERARFEKVLADPPLGLERLEAASDGVLHKGALMIEPGTLLPALLERVDVRWGEPVTFDPSARHVQGEAFDAVILATGWHMADALPSLRLAGRAGQVDWFESPVRAPASALASGHYALAKDRLRLWGANFETLNGETPAPSDEARAKNLEGLSALNPYWRQQASEAVLHARAGVRATTQDRLPLIGALPDDKQALDVFAGLRTGRKVHEEMPTHGGVYVMGGFGSRGFTWAPWAAQLLLAELLGEPLPTTRVLADLVAPGRQILRDLKRGLI